MKKIILILLIISVSKVFAEDLYSADKVIKMELQFYDDNYLYLLEKNKDSGTDIPAKLIVDDNIVIDSVGVRYKGNSSYHVKGKKKSFNVSIDAFVPGQKLYGYKTLNLNNGFVDPTFMREKIATEIFGKYIPTIKSGYVYLYVNGEEYGLYSNVQQMNKDFLGEHYSSKSGNLYKGEPHGDLIWKGYNPDNYKDNYEKKTNEEEDDWSDLISLINVINNSPDIEKELSDVLNIDRALWYFALCNAFVNLDSYIFSAHNYYIYNVPSSSTFDMLPWDLNEVFGVFPPNMPFPKEEFPPVDLRESGRVPLYKNMLSNDSFRNIYYAHYRTILKEYFNEDSIRAMIDRIKPVIQDYVKQDPIKLYSYKDFERNINENVFIEKRMIPGLLSFVRDRNIFLARLPEFSKNEPLIENVKCMTDEIFPGEKAIFNATVSGNNITRVTLFFRFADNTFQSVQMYDNGNNSDGGASDNVYGISIEIPSDVHAKKLEYYITAVNVENILVFEPERAEFEFYSKEIIQNDKLGNIVINEFMASNKTTIQDPQGSYADWIELYNRSETDINLKDWYLSDDPEDEKKWQFPEAVINAHDYIIIWADKDVEDEGLHTNFKLSQSGEFIGLYNAAGEIIDSYDFGEQETDVSEGRYPNGSGGFVPMEIPTPMAENKLFTGVDDVLVQDVVLMPNPANTVFNVRSTQPFNKLKIFNSTGICVFSSDNSNSINISNLAVGAYIVSIYYPKQVLTKKLLILR